MPAASQQRVNTGHAVASGRVVALLYRSNASVAGRARHARLIQAVGSNVEELNDSGSSMPTVSGESQVAAFHSVSG